MADLGQILAEVPDLDTVTKAVAREQVVRDVMAETGESREVVAEMLDALVSMGSEEVLDLTDGNPTTMRDALSRYVDSLENNAHSGDLAEVVEDLTTILNYPWPADEERLALHEPNSSLALHIEEGDDRDLEIRMGDNRHLIATVNWERAGSGGQAAAQEVAEAVHRAVLARVIADRDHHIQLSSPDRISLLAWLERPNGSWWPDSARTQRQVRVAMDAVQGGGVLVRTRPYRYQPIERPAARS